MPTHFDAGNERTDFLPVKTTVSTKASIFYIGLGALAEGDILSISAFFQVTNDLGYNVLVGKYLTLADGGVSHGYAIHDANGRNVTPGMHHDTVELSLFYRVPKAFSNAYLTLVGYAASTAAQSGHVVSVDGGKLTGTVWRAA